MDALPTLPRVNALTAVKLRVPEGVFEVPSYCVNKNAQPNGDHEVHDVSANKWCLPEWANRQDLGYHGSCSSAVQAAKNYFYQVNGCAWCTAACHTS